jgi:hypothetical protein
MLPKKVHQNLEGDSWRSRALGLHNSGSVSWPNRYKLHERASNSRPRFPILPVCHVGTDSQKAIYAIPVIRCQQYAAKYYELDDISWSIELIPRIEPIMLPLSIKWPR